MSRTARGYSLIETVVTFVLLAILAAVFLPQVLSSNRGTGDTAARQTLSAVIDDQSTVFSADGAFTENPQRLASFDNERDFVRGDQDSSSPDEASVAVDGERIGVAVRGEKETCWYLQHNFSGASGPTEVWAFKDNSSACKGSQALVLTRGEGTNNGSSSSRPLNLNN